MATATPYDATTKVLVEEFAADWIAYFGFPTGTVSLVDADLATVTTEADRFIRVDPPADARTVPPDAAQAPYVVHIELQSGDMTDLPLRTLRYNVLGAEKTGVPVESVAVLLRPATRWREVTGDLELPGAEPISRPVVSFRYRVLRVWETPPSRFLTGGIGLAPFALIAAGGESDAESAMATIRTRAQAELPPDKQAQFFAATYILSGLKHSETFLEYLFREVGQMTESVTYQKILQDGITAGRAEGRTEGRTEEAQNILLRVGGRRLGVPSASVVAAIRSETDVERLESAIERASEVEGWDELLPL
jgi:hypothetical protein